MNMNIVDCTGWLTRDLKRRHSWGSEADFRAVEAEAGFPSGIDPDDPPLPEEDELSYKKSMLPDEENMHVQNRRPQMLRHVGKDTTGSRLVFEINEHPCSMTESRQALKSVAHRTDREEVPRAEQENACTVQTVDLVADCPLPVLTSRIVATGRVTPPATPTLTSSSSMGQRPSTLSRPKISLTWVLRGQQQPTTATSVVATATTNRVSRGEKERSSKRSVKSVKNKDREKDGNREKENLDQIHKQEERLEKIETFEKPSEKAKLNEKLIVEPIEKQPIDKIYQDEKCSYKDAEKVRRAASEPTLAARESPATPNGREKHRHRRAKRSHKPRPPSRFGYEISDLDAFLTKASIERPANIPVVLSFPSVLYQTQGGIQDEVALPLGTVVNAVFKNQAWLYVQTPHGEEGYVGYAGCLPLGILPQPTRGPCWEDSTDVFPRPLGNMTDTEKLRDTRSECGAGRARARRGPRDSVSACGERSVDRLYLRAAANAKTKGSRHTLLVIRNDYEGRGNNTISVAKGDVVALLSGHVNEWFWVRSRDGREGFIPAVIAGHGFL